MAIAFDKYFTAQSASAGTTIAATVPAGGIAVGSTIALVTAVQIGGNCTSIVDTGGNTYTIGADMDITGGNGLASTTAWTIVTTALAQNDTITATWDSGTSRQKGIAVVSYTGTATSSVLDDENQGSQAAFPENSSPNSGNVDTTVADTVIVGLHAIHDAGALAVDFTPTTNFTERGELDGSSNVWAFQIEDRIVSSTGTYASTPTTSEAVYWNSRVYAFKVGALNVQLKRPSSTITTNAWRTDVAGTDLHTAIDETTASDSDYIQSAENPVSADISEVKFQSAEDPNVNTGHKIRYRYKKSATGGDTIDLVVRLMQGGTTIKSWTHSNIDAVTTAEQTLSGGEADSITDYTDLRLRFEATKP